MNPFVNYQKRGVALPEGCKDLIDMLPQSELEQAGDVMMGQSLLSSSSISHIDIGGIWSIESQLTCLFGSAAKRQVLGIFGDKFCVALFRDKEKFFVRFAPLPMSPDREQSVRAVFSEAKLQPIEDIATGTTHSLKYPLPTALADAVSFVIKLLQAGHGVTNESRLYFNQVP